MANISEYISKIKTAIYGKDVRGSLADGLDAVNKETEAATALAQEIDQRQTSIEKQFDDQIANMTLDDPSSAEIVAGRTNVNTGKSYDTIGRRLDAEYADVTAQLADIVTSVTTVLNAKNDGTEDVSTKLKNYADNHDEVYLYFPPGVYRWDNNIRLTNKKIKLLGHLAVIEHYGSGNNLDLGDETTHSTEEVNIQGITFVNKRPKPATNGSGVTALQIRDCKTVTLRDINVFDPEQYGINLRRANGILKNVVLDNVNVFGCSGTITGTTPIALQTNASSGDGSIENLKISNSYFEVTDSYTNAQGATTNVTLSNACKLQGCDNVEIVNTHFVNGKENGALSFLFDTKRVRLTNVTIKSSASSNNGVTIVGCPSLELTATNSDLGVENFNQSIAVNGSIKKAQFTLCKLQRLTTVSGAPKNFEFSNCVFWLPNNNLTVSFHDSVFNNCSIDPASPQKGVYVSGNNNRFINLTGVDVFEVAGNENFIDGGTCESIRPSGTSTKCTVKNIRATSSDRALRVMTTTVSDWLFKDCLFERTVAGATGFFAYLQGTRMKISDCHFSLLDKTSPVQYPLQVINTTDSEVIEKRNTFDVNKSATYNIKVDNSTGFKQYEQGDIFYNAGTRQVWNGMSFENI